MSSDESVFDEYIENVKNSVRKSFARISADLEARELETLRQLNAIRKQCQVNEELKRNCVHNLKISYENESKLLDSINRYGVINFETLDFDVGMLTEGRNNFSNNCEDHVYLFNCVRNTADNIKSAEGVVRTRRSESPHNVNLNSEPTSNNTRKCSDATFTDRPSPDNITNYANTHRRHSDGQTIGDEHNINKQTMDFIIKKEPTDDWLESIKTETDAEPVGKDMMEHINISGS